MKGLSHSLSLAVMLLCFSKLRFSLFEQLEIKLQPKERVDQEDGLNKNAVSRSKTEGHEDSRKNRRFLKHNLQNAA